MMADSQFLVRLQYRDLVGTHDFEVVVPASSKFEAVSRAREVLQFQRGTDGFPGYSEVSLWLRAARVSS